MFIRHKYANIKVSSSRINWLTTSNIVLKLIHILQRSSTSLSAENGFQSFLFFHRILDGEYSIANHQFNIWRGFELSFKTSIWATFIWILQTGKNQCFNMDKLRKITLTLIHKMAAEQISCLIIYWNIRKIKDLFYAFVNNGHIFLNFYILINVILLQD